MLIRGKPSEKDKKDKKKKKKEMYDSMKEYFMDLPKDVYADEEGARHHFQIRSQYDK